MKRLIYILFIFAFLSCGKDGSVVNKGKVMEFSVHTPEVVSTKAEVTLDRLKTAADHILIYGMSSDGNSSVPVFPSPGTVSLVYNSNTNTWKPLLKRNNEEIEFLWDEAGKMYYQFYAYAFSGNVNADNNKLEISNEAAGRQFTVEQPETAVWQAPGNVDGLVDGSGTIDYLLSYLVSETSRNGSYSVVDLKLEHAMAKVEVDVQVAAAMLGRIKNVNVEIQGIKRGATMLCLHPKLEGEGDIRYTDSEGRSMLFSSSGMAKEMQYGDIYVKIVWMEYKK